MVTVLERRTQQAVLIFDVVDFYARTMLGPTSHPRPLEPLKFWLVEQLVAGVRTVFDPPRHLVIARNPAGYHLFFGQEKLPDGSVRHLFLANGSYLIRVTSDFYQHVQQTFELPLTNLNQAGHINRYTLELEPSYNYPFPNAFPITIDSAVNCAGMKVTGRIGPTLLRGSLRSPQGKGLLGARVAAADSINAFQTDENGEWVLWFPNDRASGLAALQVTLADGTVIPPVNVCVVQGRETTRSLQASETPSTQTALRGWVLEKGEGKDGATLTISGQVNPVTSLKGGRWIYTFGANQAPTVVSVTATLNGVSQSVNNVLVRPKATVTVPIFRF